MKKILAEVYAECADEDLGDAHVSLTEDGCLHFNTGDRYALTREQTQVLALAHIESQRQPLTDKQVAYGRDVVAARINDRAEFIAAVRDLIGLLEFGDWIPEPARVQAKRVRGLLAKVRP